MSLCEPAVLSVDGFKLSAKWLICVRRAIAWRLPSMLAILRWETSPWIHVRPVTEKSHHGSFSGEPLSDGDCRASGLLDTSGEAPGGFRDSI